MMNKEFISGKAFIIIISIVFLILLFFSYKTYYLMKYNIKSLTDKTYTELIDKLEYKDKIIVKKTKINKSNYLTYENVKIRNDFKKYKEFLNNDDIRLTDYKSYKLALYDKNETLKSSFWITIWIPYYEIIKSSDSLDFFNLNTTKVVKDTYYSDLIKDNNINSDLELFEYLKNDEVKSVNIFSSKDDIKKLYAKSLFFTVALPEIEYLTKIEGDYTGYIVNAGNIKEVNIEYNDKNYIFTFISKNNEFDNKYINDILNTLVIE